MDGQVTQGPGSKVLDREKVASLLLLERLEGAGPVALSGAFSLRASQPRTPGPTVLRLVQHLERRGVVRVSKGRPVMVELTPWGAAWGLLWVEQARRPVEPAGPVRRRHRKTDPPTARALTIRRNRAILAGLRR